MDDRKEFSFPVEDLGIVSTQEVGEQIENFLDNDPSEIKTIEKKPTGEEKVDTTTKKVDPKKKDEKKDDKKNDNKDDKKDEEKEDKEVAEDTLLGEMEKKIEGEDGKDKKETKTTQQEEEDSHVFTSIAKELIEQGIFSQDEDEEGNPVEPEIADAEEFLERFTYEYRRQAAETIERFLGKFGDDYRQMFENVFVKGIKPADYLNRYSKIQGIENLDLTKEEDQERIVRELYRSEGRSSEYIEKKMQQHKNYNDLAEEATEAKNVLVAREKEAIQKAAEDKQNEIERRARMKEDYANNVGRIISEKLKAKEFDGIPVDRKLADEVMGYITQDRFKTPDGQLLTEFDKDILDLNIPSNHERKVKVAMLLQLMRRDPKFTGMAERAISKESNTLFKGLKRKSVKSSDSKKENNDDDKESQEEGVRSWAWGN